jgi:hypothetical protein
LWTETARRALALGPCQLFIIFLKTLKFEVILRSEGREFQMLPEIFVGLETFGGKGLLFTIFVILNRMQLYCVRVLRMWI